MNIQAKDVLGKLLGALSSQIERELFVLVQASDRIENVIDQFALFEQRYAAQDLRGGHIKNFVQFDAYTFRRHQLLQTFTSIRVSERLHQQRVDFEVESASKSHGTNSAQRIFKNGRIYLRI